MYFTLRQPELHSNMPYLSPISPSSTEFRKTLWKHRNSAEMGEFRGSAQNSAFQGKLWSLFVSVLVKHVKHMHWAVMTTWIAVLSKLQQHLYRVIWLHTFNKYYIFVNIYYWCTEIASKISFFESIMCMYQTVYRVNSLQKHCECFVFYRKLWCYVTVCWLSVIFSSSFIFRLILWCGVEKSKWWQIAVLFLALRSCHFFAALWILN